MSCLRKAEYVLVKAGELRVVVLMLILNHFPYVYDVAGNVVHPRH